jgi:hypothetical protein
MRCLRIYATPDGESHFGEVDIAMTMTPAFPNVAPFERSAYYPASRIRFAHIPAGVREAGFHTPPDRLLAIWLDGHCPQRRRCRREQRVSDAWSDGKAQPLKNVNSVGWHVCNWHISEVPRCPIRVRFRG